MTLPVTLLLVGILAIQCFCGADLTDEIQYYFQIQGMVATDHLFSNDLYVQQLIYILFYPIFKPFYLLFGDHGLILFGRIVFAAVLLVLYDVARRLFLRAGTDPLVSALAAFALCLAPNYHGVFAISYNTISQVGWVLATLFVVLRMSVPAWVWAAVIVTTGIAHPVGGMAIALVCAIDLIARTQVRKLATVILIAAIVSAVMIALILAMSGGIDGLRRALTFTAGFSVGATLFQSSLIWKFCGIILLIFAAGFAPAPGRATRPLIIILSFLAVICAYMLIETSLSHLVHQRWAYRYSSEILNGWVALSTLALYTFRCAQAGNVAALASARKLALLFVFQAFVLAGTSSNGINQSIGAFMVLLPMAAAGVALGQNTVTRVWLIRMPALVVALLFAIVTLGFPYRQTPLYSTDRVRSDTSMFAGLYLSRSQMEFFHEARAQIGTQLPGDRGLLLSYFPGLYPILGITPQTCMIYNHSLGTQASEDALRACLGERTIAFVALVHSAIPDPKGSRFEGLAEQLAVQRGLSCKTRPVIFRAAPPRFYAEPVISVCK